MEKTFQLSLSIIQLYIDLVKLKEFELSERLLRSTTNIRGNVEGSLAAVDKQDFMSKISVASKEALEARYWLKLIQMNYTVNSSCDECVEKLNEIITILTYMTQSGNNYKMNLNIHNLN